MHARTPAAVGDSYIQDDEVSSLHQSGMSHLFGCSSSAPAAGLPVNMHLLSALPASSCTRQMAAVSRCCCQQASQAPGWNFQITAGLMHLMGCLPTIVT